MRSFPYGFRNCSTQQLAIRRNKQERIMMKGVNGVAPEEYDVLRR